MQRALQAILVAGALQQAAVTSGAKKLTIRYGHRNYTKGPVLIGCHLRNWAHLAQLVSVRHTTLEQVTDAERCEDGYDSVAAMLVDLRRYYPDIRPESPVTVLRWDALEPGQNG